MPRIPILPKYESVRCMEGTERYYETPLGKCPSVTTILSNSKDTSQIDRWRQKVGPETADEIVKAAIWRGERHHENIEKFLMDHQEPEPHLISDMYWKSTRPFLNKVVKPLAMEGAVWHPEGYAGAFDCIAYLDEDTGEQPTLLDWKTADKIRNPAKMYEYSLQVSAYTKAANYVYSFLGLNITKAMVVVALPNQDPQITKLDAEDIDQLFLHFQARLHRYTFAR